MLPPKEILSTWRKFDRFPMETLTKIWVYNNGSKKKQRDVSQMKEHREQYGITGNCFDLAIWLLDEFKKDGIESYPIGHDLGTEDAHVAVMALDEFGNRFLCDLGDQWLKPILIDTRSEEFTAEKLSGFFPAAEIQVRPNGKNIEILYHRPNGKVSNQEYNITTIEMEYFMQAAEVSQNVINPKPLLECRVPYKAETAHWEFYNWESFLSTSEGLFNDPKLNTIEEWVAKLNEKTGYDIRFLENALKQYDRFPKVDS
ncbi:hypothetical protein ACTWQL_14180 [Pseudalkalibacillus sp. R45]|uniref:hypothetical protein n=1 Tax=Pseudalkalibacillus sp. R45 TaxID=3457433 RepID=UPI003FCC3AC2